MLRADTGDVSKGLDSFIYTFYALIFPFSNRDYRSESTRPKMLRLLNRNKACIFPSLVSC